MRSHSSDPVAPRPAAAVVLRLAVALVTAAATAACGDSTAAEDLHFPKGFLFGTATAGFQVEMGCPTVAADRCEDRHSDWYDFITTPELVMNKGLYLAGDPPSSGPGFYELYAQDLDRAKGELHNNAFRLSIEWSRLFPTATFGKEGDALKAAASPDALAYYHALFAALRARGLVPLVTLNHYTLPSWIHDAAGCHADLDTCKLRGWLDDRIVDEMAKYAGFAAREFGGEVDLWATLNEPLTAVVLASYVLPTSTRVNPPGVSLRLAEAKRAMVAMEVAHARMYDAVKKNDTVAAAGGGGPAARVGIVFNLQAVAPSDPTNPLDVTGAKNASYLVNTQFLDAVIKGDVDAELDGKKVHRADLAGRMDFLGINYYARLVVTGTTSSLLPQLSPLLTFNVLQLEYDYDYPKGIAEVIALARPYGVPMAITETGYADAGDTGKAAAWVARTLTWVKRAMAEGAPVEGYYYWTLMDNYEWNHGMTIRMGLYAVDPKDPMKRRTARSPVGVYGRIAAAGEIPADLAARYPTPR